MNGRRRQVLLFELQAAGMLAIAAVLVVYVLPAIVVLGGEVDVRSFPLGTRLLIRASEFIEKNKITAGIAAVLLLVVLHETFSRIGEEDEKSIRKLKALFTILLGVVVAVVAIAIMQSIYRLIGQY